MTTEEAAEEEAEGKFRTITSPAEKEEDAKKRQHRRRQTTMHG